MRFLGAVYLTVAAGIWGGLYAVSNWVLGGEYIQPFTLLVVRLSATSIVLGAILMRRGELSINLGELKDALAFGFVGYVASLGLQFTGTKWAGAANGSLITATTPAFIVLFAALLLRERITPTKALAVALATAGVTVVIGPQAIMVTQGDRALMGKWMLLIAGLTWGLYTVMAKRFSARHGALATTFWACLVGAFMNIPLAVLETPVRPLAQWPLTAYIGVAYISLVSTAVAFYLWNLGFELMDAQRASVFFFVQPAVGSFLGWKLLGEPLGPGFLIGGLLILAGLVVSTLNTPASVNASQKEGYV